MWIDAGLPMILPEPPRSTPKHESARWSISVMAEIPGH
jgi:hypothetical protein